MIHFGQPYFWNALILVVLIAGLLSFLVRMRRKAMNRFGDKRLMAVTAQSFSARHFVWKEILLVLVFLMSVIALTRPQWGFDWQEVKRQGVDILVAVDTSRSMLTEDVRPSRLERARLAVKDMLKKLQGDRVGLIAFSGDAFLMCPLTVDYNGFLLSLDDLTIESIPRGGTNLGRAIDEALKGFGDIPSKYKAVVILTDGESWEGDPVKWAKAAAEKKVRVYTVGIGTREGELVRVTGADGAQAFLKDSLGNFIKSRLNEDMLKEIAAVTGGAYVRASGSESGLDYIYDHYLTHLEKREIESRMEQRYHERFQIPLLLALVFLFLETRLSSRRPEP
ncbi:MAG: VWA domain-containing protein [Candidatus Omnitrophota bacterium]